MYNEQGNNEQGNNEQGNNEQGNNENNIGIIGPLYNEEIKPNLNQELINNLNEKLKQEKYLLENFNQIYRKQDQKIQRQTRTKIENNIKNYTEKLNL